MRSMGFFLRLPPSLLLYSIVVEGKTARKREGIFETGLI